MALHKLGVAATCQDGAAAGVPLPRPRCLGVCRDQVCGSPVFKLPEADRPAEESVAAVCVGGPNVGDVELHPNGLVIPFSGGSGNRVYGFAGLSFKAASC